MSNVKLDSSADIETGYLALFLGDGNPLAFEKSSKLTINADEIDISNKTMGDWTGSLVGKKSYTIASEALTTKKTGAYSYDALFDAFVAKSPISFTFGHMASADSDNFGGTFTPDATKDSYTGKVIITSIEITSEAGNIVTCSANFKGFGALTKVKGTAV